MDDNRQSDTRPKYAKGLVDIENLIRERKFILIEQHVNDILDCVLESEFDVRILDEGVLKIFRLAQLAVEYHQFCRHYLDRSVYVLREEVTALAEELDATKKILNEKEEEIRRLRKRSKSAYRTALPYGNENIATMILKTLSNKSDIFSRLTPADTMQHNKCTHCDKVFLNQLYLQSHMSRRHANMLDIPQKDIDNNQSERNSDKNVKLNDELSDLRKKLADMEQLVTNLKSPTVTENKSCNKINTEPKAIKEMKDAEVSTNGEGYILDKIEEWKKEERDTYNKEMNSLRTQIIAMLDSFKEKETTPKHDLSIMDELRATIKQQGLEILALKQELTNSVLLIKPNTNTEEVAQRKEIETQMAYWVNKAELQSNEYKLLLQKLEAVAKEAEKSRAQAEIEKNRVLQLQNLLEEKSKSHKNGDKHIQEKVAPVTSEINTTESAMSKNKPQSNIIRDRISIKKLQQKAQELLDIENMSSSDISTSTDETKAKTNEKKTKTDGIVVKIPKTGKIKTLKDANEYDSNHKSSPSKQENRIKRRIKTLSVTESSDYKRGKLAEDKNKGHLKETLNSKKENGKILPGSPMKIIRAKITEEVNNRLVSLGVDPLKTRLPDNIFSKQKLQLQEQQQIKFKKYPESEQVFHTLLTNLNADARTLKTTQTDVHHKSPTKNRKSFSLSSVISNVKTKALSLVKTNEHNKNEYKSYDDVAKKAIMLLRTPSSSENSSPKLQAQANSSVISTESQNTKKKKGKNVKTKTRSSPDHNEETIKHYETDTDSTESQYSEHRYNMKHHDRTSRIIEKLVKSPIHRPSDLKLPNYTTNTENKNTVIPTTTKIELQEKKVSNIDRIETNENSSDGVDSLVEQPPRRAYSVENITKLTKGVLKNASSMSSLNKKKVIFDMDAIQMKSVSASSPSQSVTEKSDGNEKYGLGLVNLDNEEWDISSIENEPIQKNPVISRTSPKIAELKETIESQLTRRNNTMSTVLVGGVDVLQGPLLNKAVIGGKGGSNTSLGSSILDDTDSTPAHNQVAFVKPRTFIEKDDSEVDISEFVTDELITKNTNIIKT